MIHFKFAFAGKLNYKVISIFKQMHHFRTFSDNDASLFNIQTSI